MSDSARFRDQVLEISEDLRGEVQYVQTFWNDPELRCSVEGLIGGALQEARAQGRRSREPDGAFLRAGLMLLTYGFYLGREHARRGYPPPMPATGQDEGFFPDTPATLGDC